MNSALYSRARYGTCCVVPGCSFRSGTNAISTIRTFTFPKDATRRAIWTQAIRRDGWQAKCKSAVCSKHFVEGKPSDDPNHPDWIPSVFPFKKNDAIRDAQKMSRYNRFQARRNPTCDMNPSVDVDTENDNKDSSEIETECQKDASTLTDFTVQHFKTLHSENHALKKRVVFLEKQVVALHNKGKALAIVNETLNRSVNSNTAVQRLLQNDRSVKFNTGLQNTNVFWTLLQFLLSFWKPTTKVNLEPSEQFLLVLMRLRLGLLVEDLGNRFGISPPAVSSIFHDWLIVMAVNFQKFIKWPKRKNVMRSLPPDFKDKMFKNVRGIIDCSEVFIEKPSNLHARAQTYSRYKSHNTAKFLVTCTPTGAISFISKAWGGRVTDKQLTAGCGLLDLVEEGDVFLVDRGFRCEEMFATKNSTLMMPAFTKGKEQLSGEEVTLSRKMSRVRIHVERTIQRLKNFRIFSTVLPISTIRRSHDDTFCSLDNILIVCSALVNLQTPLISNIEQA